MKRWVAGAVSLLALSQAAQAASDPAACIYKSESYSEGAAICVQKGLMLSCVSSGERLLWKVAREAELSDLCRASQPWPAHTSAISHRSRRTPIAARVPVSNAKCFFFNGRTYCE